MEVIKNLMITDKVICYSSEWFKDITESSWSVHINISLNKIIDLPDNECIEYFNNLSMNNAKEQLVKSYQWEPITTKVQFVYKLT